MKMFQLSLVMLIISGLYASAQVDTTKTDDMLKSIANTLFTGDSAD